jgi:hypothetical protein
MSSSCTICGLLAHRTFSKIDHILGHKASFSKYKKTGITLCNLSERTGIKLEINSKNKKTKLQKMSKHMNNTLLSDQWVIEEIRAEKKNSKNIKKMKTQLTRTLGYSKASSKRKVYCYELLHHREILNK